jgi:hypothetical protein
MHPKKVEGRKRVVFIRKVSKPPLRSGEIALNILDFKVTSPHNKPCPETASRAFISLKGQIGPEAAPKTF